jgi:hypothetical protein
MAESTLLLRKNATIQPAVDFSGGAERRPLEAVISPHSLFVVSLDQP